MLRAFVFNRLFVRFDLDGVHRFAAWLDSRNPPQAHDALTMVDRALRDTSFGATGQRRYLLTGFDPDGKPLIEAHAAPVSAADE